MPKKPAGKPKKVPRSRPKLTPDPLLSDDGLGFVLRYFPCVFKTTLRELRERELPTKEIQQSCVNHQWWKRFQLMVKNVLNGLANGPSTERPQLVRMLGALGSSSRR